MYTQPYVQFIYAEFILQILFYIHVQVHNYIFVPNSKLNITTILFRFLQECKTTTRGQEYRGQISETETGRKCQQWKKHSPHPHWGRFEKLENNYCRNPDNEPKGPWCYTVDLMKRWEYCSVPTCGQCIILILNEKNQWEYRDILLYC